METIDTPTLFLPGTLCDERIWMPIWKNLICRQRIYVPLQWASTLDEMLALTTDRITAFSEPVHLVGYSMGAYIATLTALNSNSVASLTLIGYSPEGLTHEELGRRKKTIQAIDKGLFNPTNPLFLQRYFTEKELTQRVLTQPIIDMASDLGGSTLKAHFSATTPRQDLSARIKTLTLPITMIAAAHDVIASAGKIKAIAQSMKNASYNEFDDTAHMMPLTKANEIAAILTNTLD